MLKKYKQSGKPLSEKQLKAIKGGYTVPENDPPIRCITSEDCPSSCYEPFGGYWCQNRRCVWGYC